MARNKLLSTLFELLKVIFRALLQSETKPSVSPDAQPPSQFPDSPSMMALLREAEASLGVSYTYGGNSPQEGFDCSGLLCYLFGKIGYTLPRVSSAQAQAGIEVPLTEARPCDIAYFSHDGTRVNHTGLVVSRPGEPLTMIHSSSSKGVIRTQVSSSSYWKPRMLGIRRIVE